MLLRGSQSVAGYWVHAVSFRTAQLRSAQSTLAERDNSLSVFERQWAQLEEQLALLLAGLENKPAEAAAEAPSVPSAW